MDFNSLIKGSFKEMTGMFGLSCEFLEENREESLSSKNDINILIGLTNGLRGNILISLDSDTSLRIVSAMMGGMTVDALDEMGKSALGEFTNMLSGSVLGKIQSERIIDLSPPTLILGKNLYLMISRVPSEKLEFQVAGKTAYISFSLE